MRRALPLVLRGALLGALVWMGACTVWHKSKLQPDYRALQADIATATSDPWAEVCAPRELALAITERDFAEVEFKEGDPRRASEHLAIATENIAIALSRAKVCRPTDRDGDGISDKVDQCPDDPEDIDQFEDEDGCPELDNDKDGLADTVDSCPNDPEDIDTFEDTDGCPDPDNDKDKILDGVDKCPNDAEDYNGIDDADGCPEKDTDGDGYLDAVDKCPTEAENFNQYLDEDGCPDTKPANVNIAHGKIEIGQKVFFEVNKTIIKPVSYGILNEVAQVMKDYPALTVRVEGHTDSDGSDASNMTLSQGRSESVMTYLVSQGVAPNRLTAQGFGESRPIDTNKTSAGKANNRRVEFLIVSGL